jgi:hypothetical protein
VIYSYEQRRMEVTFKGGQDSYRVVEPMMMMMMMMMIVLYKVQHLNIRQLLSVLCCCVKYNLCHFCLYPVSSK